MPVLLYHFLNWNDKTGNETMNKAVPAYHNCQHAVLESQGWNSSGVVQTNPGTKTSQS